MRSAREIHFRIAQQWENGRLFLFPPSLSKSAKVADLTLPDPRVTVETLRGSDFAAEIETIAREILEHRFRLFAGIVETGPAIEWRKDYVHGRGTGTDYFRFIPYLDFAKAGDHKNIWELNRHQHLIILAQAWLFTRDRAFLTELEAQLSQWFQQNPFLRGINYTSALEVAFRALSWLWVDHLAGTDLDPRARSLLQNGMFQHGHFLQANLSTYFSPNTHLLGEGVALYALGLKFPSSGWALLGEKVVEEERVRQLQADGSHFEQSTYYHVYALDFLSFYYVLAKRPNSFEEPLRAMARFLTSLQGPAGLLNFFGDDDGGRLFHPYGNRAAFGRATLATCAGLFPGAKFPVDATAAMEQAAWWIGPVAPIDCLRKNSAERFPESGLVSIVRGPLHLVMDTGPFGPGGAGHSHSDSLSFTASWGETDLLIDPGTFTYVADPEARNAFRGSAYHNTVRVDLKDQAKSCGPFRWTEKPRVWCNDFREEGETVYVDAACAYRNVVHRRRWFLIGDRILFVLDHLTGPEGTHSIEQFWHVGNAAFDRMAILSDAPAAKEQSSGWRSRCLGSKENSPVVTYRWQGTFPIETASVFIFGSQDSPFTLETFYGPNSTAVKVPGVQSIEFPDNGPARVFSS